MKIRTNLIAFLLCFTVQSNGPVYAQYDPFSNDILDLIPYGAMGSRYQKFSVELCKDTLWVDFNCGDGKGGWVDNFYVIYIAKDEVPAKGSPLIQLEDDSLPKTEIPNSFCKSDSIEYTRIRIDDLPSDMQNDVKSDPRYKTHQAVYHRFRVRNGIGKERVRLKQLCEVQEETN